ncbi:hypothetical protein TorRG33x02_000780 [Trema orientale]|uniref:Uncharacterized protein n=1 Tax=Trema orientale TaxID=63057 RepID=A0A2P5G144_TREOI|nr:hypothetical protein TorRG33x02_000780 [Trema orientale]
MEITRKDKMRTHSRFGEKGHAGCDLHLGMDSLCGENPGFLESSDDEMSSNGEEDLSTAVNSVAAEDQREDESLEGLKCLLEMVGSNEVSFQARDETHSNNTNDQKVDIEGIVVLWKDLDDFLKKLNINLVSISAQGKCSTPVSNELRENNGVRELKNLEFNVNYDRSDRGKGNSVDQ